jgi:hypothetical protein
MNIDNAVIPGRASSREPGIHDHGRKCAERIGVMDSEFAGKSPRPE